MPKMKGTPTRFPGVRRLNPGLYRVRLRYTHPKTGRASDTSRDVKARSAAEANEMRASLVEEAIVPLTFPRPTLRGYAIRWLPSKLPELKASTRRLYAGYLDNHILPGVAGVMPRFDVWCPAWGEDDADAGERVEARSAEEAAKRRVVWCDGDSGYPVAEGGCEILFARDAQGTVHKVSISGLGFEPLYSTEAEVVDEEAR